MSKTLPQRLRNYGNELPPYDIDTLISLAAAGIEALQKNLALANARIAELKAQIASAQQQEPVLYQRLRHYADSWSNCPKHETENAFPGFVFRKLYAAPVIVQQLLTDALDAARWRFVKNLGSSETSEVAAMESASDQFEDDEEETPENFTKCVDLAMQILKDKND